MLTGYKDVCDNCKSKPNHEQSDVDGDGVGDDCDNCQFTPNADQSDIDLDGFGDVCDNCMRTANADQKDTDHDGIGNVCEGEDQGVGTLTPIGEPISAIRFVGDKRYELSNHLGNVLSVITDRKLVGGVTGYLADVISYSDYDPYGMQVPNRFYNGSDYRYGFQGQEKDNEIKGEGNSLNYTFRMHDPRVGRFFAVDPLFKEYPELTPYQFSSNSPIDMVEIEGLEGGWVVNSKGQAQYQSGPVANTFDSEAAARRAASMGMKTPNQVAQADKAWLDWQSRAPKVQRPKEEVRSNSAEDVMNRNRDMFLGGRYSIGGGIIDGAKEGVEEVVGVKIVTGTLDAYKVFKVYKQSKLALKAVESSKKIIKVADKAHYHGMEFIDDGIRSIEIPVQIEAVKITAYEIAKNGGSHAGFYKNALSQSKEQLQKGIKKLQRQIDEHTALINDPKTTMEKLGKGDWDLLDSRQQKALIEKKWPSDIMRQKEQQEILTGILKNGG